MDEFLQVLPAADAPLSAVPEPARDAVSPRERVLAQVPAQEPLVLLVLLPAGLQERVLPRAQAQRVSAAQAPPLLRHALRELEEQQGQPVSRPRAQVKRSLELGPVSLQA
jgi:hypothetical protein